jgi:anti-sigma factor RsiW
MEQISDDRLVAYLDGEVDPVERGSIESWIATDRGAREKLAALAESAQLLRLAFDEVMHESVPERLIAAARGETQPPEAQILPFRGGGRSASALAYWRWRIALPVAAALFGLMIGGGAGYYGGLQSADGGGRVESGAASAPAALSHAWLDTAAGYFNLFVRAGDNAFVEVSATGNVSAGLQKISQSLPQALRLPNLKPWGLDFRGARLVMVAGHPAAQIVYTTANRAIGPLSLFVGSSKAADVSPTLERRQNVNLLYWRHQGRLYVLVGKADFGYLRSIANDVAWQLDAI